MTKAPLTVTASSTSMTYGGTVPTITAAYSGFVNGDSSSSLTTKPTCSTVATSASPVLGSPYATSCGGAVDPNYAISYFGGSVTVNTATLTITAGSPTMTYGGSVPAITAAYAGFKNGDTASSLSTAPTCSTTATSASTVAGSPYQTFCSGAADSNYTIGYVTGALTVGKAPLTITASSGSMTYGGTVPTITPMLRRLRQRRHGVVAHHPAHVLDDGHQLELGLGLPLFVLVQRSGGPELHHRAGERLGDGGQGPARRSPPRAAP